MAVGSLQLSPAPDGTGAVKALPCNKVGSPLPYLCNLLSLRQHHNPPRNKLLNYLYFEKVISIIKPSGAFVLFLHYIDHFVGLN